MFTGIVTDVGKISTIEKKGDMRYVIETSYDPTTIALGASIMCDGCCLTVVEKGTMNGTNWFAVDVSKETLDCTSLADWTEGRSINLERSEGRR